jgi:tRNA threonylcarbamoyladenosine biosynthesis protein TsaB
VILSLDTTSEFGSIALTDASGTLDEVLLHSPDGFGHVLFEHVERLLQRHVLNVRDMECFAAASGPGSFTGVRVGLSAVKGLAEATGRPVVAVSNLQALAAFGSAPLRAVVMDARRGDIFGAVYDWELRLVQAEVVMKFPAWLETLPQSGIEFVAADFAPFQPFVDAAIPVVTAPRALAGAIGRIARETGRFRDPAAVDANYVRRSDAELFWTDPSASGAGC